jgi:hypothetical protein
VRVSILDCVSAEVGAPERTSFVTRLCHRLVAVQLFFRGPSTVIASNRSRILSTLWFAVLVILCNLAAGCSESADQAVARRKVELNIKDVPTAKFSGKVSIDNQAPQLPADHNLLTFLFDPKSPPKEGHPPRYTVCQPDGTFQFNDVPPGSYVVLFGEFRRGRPGVFHGPDALKNLYNDPDKNATQDVFKVDLASSGKSGQTFNLEVAGKEGVTSPGPQAVAQVTRAGH